MSIKNHQLQNSTTLVNFQESLLAEVGDARIVSAVLDKVQKWAGEQPLITALLCGRILTQADKIANEKDADIVDAIVQKQIIRNWEKGAAADHLQEIQTALLAYGARDSLLILYLQILQRGDVPSRQSPEQTLLLDSGLVTLDHHRLKVTNAIYAQVFDKFWIERQLPGITKPVKITRTASGGKRATQNPLKRAYLSPWLQPPAVQTTQSILIGCGVLLLTAAVAWVIHRAQNPQAGAWNLGTPAVINDAENGAEQKQPATAELPSQALTPLTLLGDTFSGYSTFRNGDFQSVLQDVGIQINYADEFDQGLRAQQLSQGKADLIMTTLDQFLQQQPKGKIVALLDRTLGADAVVLNTKQYSTLTSLLDLNKLVQQAREQNKKLSIAYANDTPSEYLALVLDARFDTFNLSDFDLKPVADASEAWALMQDPQENIAIAVLWEPYVTQARQQGYSVVLSSKDAPTAIVDVMVASDRLLASNPEIISQLLEKYYRQIDANVRDATQLQTQVAEDGNLSVTDAATIIDGIDFFTATEAKNWFDNGTLKKRIEATAAILTLSARLDTVPTNTTALYTEEFVTEAANNTQALIDLIRTDNPELADKLSGKLPAVTAASPVSTAQIQQAQDIGTLQVRGQVSFTTGSAQLTPEGQKTLDQLASELQDFNQETVAVRIMGHTSRTGDANTNLALSEQRASIVASYLQNQGVTLNILPEGKGSLEPLPEIEPTNARNQRTEIRLVRIN
ncbi:MAG: OmpA family protein [Phormidesmis sp. RL_2_1]|nr:OmpA family protein [Phormidesmis sp. RL_2_1]